MTSSITLATWNVNSIKARLTHVCDWLRQTSIDIVCLQELKCETDALPRTELEDLGYNVIAHGQKTYNGVAILSKYPLELETTALPGDLYDEQARYIEAVVSLPENNALRIASIYVPNGQEVNSDKFMYKMAFYDRLYAHMKQLLSYNEMTVMAADYNVAPANIDVYDPKSLAGTICFHPNEQAKFRALENLGYYDAFRALNPIAQQFSWWDYRGGGYQKGKGLRIDHLLLSPLALDNATQCWVDEAPRGWEKPSDHTPVIMELALV